MIRSPRNIRGGALITAKELHYTCLSYIPLTGTHLRFDPTTEVRLRRTVDRASPTVDPDLDPIVVNIDPDAADVIWPAVTATSASMPFILSVLGKACEPTLRP